MAKSVYMGIRITPEQYKFLVDYSKVNNVKVAAVARKAIATFIDNYSVEVQSMDAKLDRIDAKLDLVIKALGEINGHSH